MNVLGYLQQLGKALMLPIAVLPVAALLLRLGQDDLLALPFIAAAGDAIFKNLPLLFSMGIAVGLSKDSSGAAALAGTVGYLTLVNSLATIDESINMSFFGGIISGVIAGHVYNRFYTTTLPSYLGFFNGKRLVPIVTGVVMLLVTWLCSYVWPSVQQGLDAFGHAVAGSGSVGHFVYGFLNRSLIPLGLHHVLNSYFWFGLGTYTDPAGQVFQGDLHRFFAGDPTAGVFMTGFYPIMMFGLPAAALAMYLGARPQSRKSVGGLLFSLSFTALLTGITEPLEFTFMFMAPSLYVIHAALTGLSLVVTNALGMLHGFGFSAGLFDLVLNWNRATNPAGLVLTGLVFSVLYFILFFLAIKLFDLKTPGREDEQQEGAATKPLGDAGGEGSSVLARHYAQALGGVTNLTSIDACITRLRLTVASFDKIDEKRLKTLGARGVVRLGDSGVQVIVGPEAEVIAGAIQNIPADEDLSAFSDLSDQSPTTIVPDQKTSQAYLAALGGQSNIAQMSACVTRLRLTLADRNSVDEKVLKQLGARAVIPIGEAHLQVVVGPVAELLCDRMKASTI